jgi:hypothetical protein
MTYLLLDCLYSSRCGFKSQVLRVSRFPEDKYAKRGLPVRVMEDLMTRTGNPLLA